MIPKITQNTSIQIITLNQSQSNIPDKKVKAGMKNWEWLLNKDNILFTEHWEQLTGWSYFSHGQGSTTYIRTWEIMINSSKIKIKRNYQHKLLLSTKIGTSNSLRGVPNFYNTKNARDKHKKI